MGFTNILDKFKITPDQMLHLLGIVKGLQFIDESPVGSVFTYVMQGNFEQAWNGLKENAESLYGRGQKYEEFIKMIVSLGTIRFLIAIVQQIVSGLRA